MALQKSIMTPHGVTASYWKVTRIDIDSSTFFIQAVVSGFYDGKARLDGKEALLAKQYAWLSNATDFENEISTGSNIIANIYERIKLTEDFIDATDI